MNINRSFIHSKTALSKRIFDLNICIIMNCLNRLSKKDYEMLVDNHHFKIK